MIKATSVASDSVQQKATSILSLSPLLPSLFYSSGKGFIMVSLLFCNALCLWFLKPICPFFSLFLFLNVPKFWKHLEECCTIMESFKLVWSLVPHKKPHMGCVTMWISCHSWYIIRVVMLYKTAFVKRN